MVVLVLAVSAAAQPSKSAFRWDYRKVERLDYRNTIKKATYLSTADRAAVINAVSAGLRDWAANKKIRAKAENVAVKLIDLNGDGVPEVIAQSFGFDICSPTGNCPIWVLQRAGRKYKIILGRNAIQTFTIQPTRTSGYIDLVLGMHGSATEQELFVYRFRNGRYRQTECYDPNWTHLGKDGEYHELKEPRIARCNR